MSLPFNQVAVHDEIRRQVQKTLPIAIPGSEDCIDHHLPYEETYIHLCAQDMSRQLAKEWIRLVSHCHPNERIQIGDVLTSAKLVRRALRRIANNES